MDVANQLLKFARSDMRKARKESQILIAQTKRGTVTLTYSRMVRRYSAAANGVVLFNCGAQEAERALIKLYDVQVEE